MQPVHKIGVGDEGASKGHEVTFAGCEVGLSAIEGFIATGKDVGTFEVVADDVFDVFGNGWGAHRAVIDHVDVGEAEVGEFDGKGAVECVHVVVGFHVVEDAVGGNAHADAGGTDAGGNLLGYGDGEANTMFNGATPCIGALVGGGVEELVDEVTIRGMKFDAIEAGLDGAGGSIDVGLNGLLDVLFSHGGGNGVGLHGLLVGPHGSGHGDGGRSKDTGTFRHVEGMGDATGVHDLEEDLSALLMDGGGDGLPSGDLVLIVDAGNAGVPYAIRGGGGAFGDDESGGGALMVVGGHEGRRDVVRGGPATGHGGHDDAIGQGEGAEGHGGEERGVLGHVRVSLVKVSRSMCGMLKSE